METKKRASISAMMAANEGLKLLTEFSGFKYGIDFTNFNEVKDNYSVSMSMEFMALDIVIYFIVGLCLEGSRVLFNYLYKLCG